MFQVTGENYSCGVQPIRSSSFFVFFFRWKGMGTLGSCSFLFCKKKKKKKKKKKNKTQQKTKKQTNKKKQEKKQKKQQQQTNKTHTLFVTSCVLSCTLRNLL